MNDTNIFRLAKSHCIEKGKPLPPECIQQIIEKPAFTNVDKIFVIEDITGNKIYLYPYQMNKLPVLVQLKTATKKELNESLTQMMIYLKQLDLAAIFDSGICPREEDCRWMGYFWASNDSIPTLEEIAKKMKPAEMKTQVLE